MRIVLDIEANGLKNPTKIWCAVCKDIDTGEIHIFRNLCDDEEQAEAFSKLLSNVSLVVGHNLIEYDEPVIRNRLRIGVEVDKCLDTLVLSRLINYSNPDGHSIEAYGKKFGLEKIDIGKGVKGFNPFFNQWSQEMEDYCVRDVEICLRIYQLFLPVINDPAWHSAITLEQAFQRVVNDLHDAGFAFNTDKASNLLLKVTDSLTVLDKEIRDAFPPRLHFIRQIDPKLTKYGSIHRGDFRWVKSGDLSEFNGGSFSHCSWQEFNPSSHKQLIEVLHTAGWKPSDRTKTHVETERQIAKLKRIRNKSITGLDLEELSAKMIQLGKYGFKINEENLATLPPSAPGPARLLAKRILLESRRRTLTEWLGLVQQDNRIHGKFYGIGAWTHRMAHQQPNTANIPNSHDINGKVKLLGKELRSLWIAPKRRLLIGVDAEGIQLRIFAHYVNDKELTQSLIDGRKDNKTDPHSLNQRVLGSICKSRAAAKRFLYALLLGGGVGKFAEILECTEGEAAEAVDIFLKRYPGLNQLRRERFPRDAERGYFIGLDGRKVRIPGDTASNRRHLCMSGYLQNGEAIIMKMATLKWSGLLKKEYNCWLVNFVHDEWQTEAPNNMNVAIEVAKLQADSLRIVGEELGLKCPLAGSYYNDDVKDYTIGTNWSVTH